MDWIIENSAIDENAIGDNGNRLLIGNGYLGIRGTLDEQGKEQMAAVNLAGIYDRVGSGWREPLNAPNPLFTQLLSQGQPLEAASAQTHTQGLDYRHGIYYRRTVWDNVILESRRAAHKKESHLILSRCRVSTRTSANLTLFAGIEDNIWELHGPHYSKTEFSLQGNIITCLAYVQNGKDLVAVGRRCSFSGCPVDKTFTGKGIRYDFSLGASEEAVLTCVSAVYTTRDCSDPLSAVLKALQGADYDALCASHAKTWEALWAVAEVEIDGDDTAREAINYSIYHLNSIAPQPGSSLSIPARGLSGQTYKGAIFWDSEMFLLDHFLYTQPEVAKSLVRYRIETLPGALAKAKEYGWQGAFYAWESQEGGFDACSDYNVTDVFTGRPMRTFFRDKQVHISAAVARAIMAYSTVTGDVQLLAQGGAKTILECARFYLSLLVKRSTSDKWEIHDVIGPDEYHERVNNNAYTNRMALATFRWAIEAVSALEEAAPEAYRQLIAETDTDALLPKLRQAAQDLYIPAPNAGGIIEQFDGYFALEDASLSEVRSRLLDPKEYWGGAYGVASHTQIIKQADIVTMLEFFHADYPLQILKANLDYYAPRTEHGSSLSACMYALLSCRCGEPEEAYPFFLRSAQADIRGGGKQWAGLVYIGGTHPAAAGGAWKVVTQGFCGLELTPDGPRVTPCLPKTWQKVSFRFQIRDVWYQAVVTHEKGEIIKL